jgi:Protein of unknown function (DUF2752)
MEITVEQKSSTIERILAATGILAVAAGSAVVWYFNPSNVNFLPVCPLYSMTGLACPGCGLTRGFHALFHGDVLTALDFNALLPLFGLIFGYLFLGMFLVAVRGHGLSIKYFRPGLLYGFLVILIGFAVLRNLPIYPFSVLYP